MSLLNLKVGDILKTPSGDLRVVREVDYNADGTLWMICLAIRRCSWTRRAYTMLTPNDLRARKFKPTGKRVRLTGKLDRRLARDIASNDPDRRGLDCCAVRGMP